jgi:hypothetical protein
MRATRHQHGTAALATEEEPGLEDLGGDQDGMCLGDQLQRVSELLVEL